jgi:hypothetical protein
MAALALLEVLERDGRVRRVLEVQRWPVTIGRALDNDLVLDDPHVAPHHARLELDEAGIAQLEALPSVNGAWIGTRRLAGGARAALWGTGRSFTLGVTRLRLLLAGDPLAPERVLEPGRRDGVTIALALALWAFMLAGHGIELDPGSKASEWLGPLLGLPAVLAVWCALWALATKLFLHRLEFWAHLGVAVRWMLAAEVAGFALAWAAAPLGWAWPSRVAPLVVGALGAALVWNHARIVLPQLHRPLAWTAVFAYLAGSGILLGLNQQRQDRWFSQLYLTALPPPALLWAAPVPPADFVTEAAARLRAPLEASVREADAEAKAGSASDDE